VGIEVQRLSARILVVVCLATLAGLTAWLATLGKTPLYEREVTFVVLPTKQSGLSDVQGQVDSTIAAGIGSKFMLGRALGELGYSPESAKDYSLQAFVRPGQDVIDSRLRGPNVRFLTSLANAYIRTSQRWSSGHYAAYDLNYLESIAAPGPVSPHPKRAIGLGVVLGGLLGLLVLYVGSQLASRRDGLHRTLLEVPESERVEDEPETGSTLQRNDEAVRELDRRDGRSRGDSAAARRRRRRAGDQGH
jgi:hypothetical protein